MNNASINLRSYYNNHVFLLNFAWPDVGEFWTWLGKMRSFFYYTSTDANAVKWFLPHSTSMKTFMRSENQLQICIQCI